jgi:hypothetical protein
VLGVSIGIVLADLQLSKYWSNICHPMGGHFGRHRSVAVWRPSRQARSFEGSGHLGPDDRARVQLESPRLGVPATRRAKRI